MTRIGVRRAVEQDAARIAEVRMASCLPGDRPRCLPRGYGKRTTGPSGALESGPPRTRPRTGVRGGRPGSRYHRVRPGGSRPASPFWNGERTQHPLPSAGILAAGSRARTDSSPRDATHPPRLSDDDYVGVHGQPSDKFLLTARRLPPGDPENRPRRCVAPDVRVRLDGPPDGLPCLGNYAGRPHAGTNAFNQNVPRTSECVAIRLRARPHGVSFRRNPVGFHGSPRRDSRLPALHAV